MGSDSHAQSNKQTRLSSLKFGNPLSQSRLSFTPIFKICQYAKCVGVDDADCPF